MLDCGGNSTTPNKNTPPAVTVSLSPQLAQVALLGQTQFTATVTGGSGGVTWAVNGSAGGGSSQGVISSSGLYTAPTTLPSPNSVTVTAVSVDLGSIRIRVSDDCQSATRSFLDFARRYSFGKRQHEGDRHRNGICQRVSGGDGRRRLPTLFWNPTALTATIPAAILSMPGAMPVLVTTPGPGGGTSSAVNFTIQAGVFATANPQVAMYAYGVAAGCLRLR